MSDRPDKPAVQEPPFTLPSGWCTLGVGSGDTGLFVYGPYDAIKECQRRLLERNAGARATETHLTDEQASRGVPVAPGALEHLEWLHHYLKQAPVSFNEWAHHYDAVRAAIAGVPVDAPILGYRVDASYFQKWRSIPKALRYKAIALVAASGVQEVSTARVSRPEKDGAPGFGSAPAAGNPTLGELIAKVGGRINDAGYVEFGSEMAVAALVRYAVAAATSGARACHNPNGCRWVECDRNGRCMDKPTSGVALPAQAQRDAEFLRGFISRSGRPGDDTMLAHCAVERLTSGVAGLDAVTADAERLCWALRPLVRLVPAGSGECWVRFKVGSQEFTIGNQSLAEDEAAHFAGLFVFALAGAFRTLPAGVSASDDETFSHQPPGDNT